MLKNNRDYLQSNFSSDDNRVYNGLNGTKGMHSNSDTFNIAEVFLKLWRKKWLLLSIVLFTTIVAAIIVYNIPDVYESKGRLIVTGQSNSVLSGSSGGNSIFSNSNSSGIASLYGYGTSSAVVNQMEILKSGLVLNGLAKEIDSKRTMPNGKRFPILWKDYPDDSTLVSQEDLVERLKNKMTVTQKEWRSNVIDISFQSNSKIEASTILNLIIDNYTNLSTQENRRAASSALDYLANQKKQVTDDLNSSEEALRSFMKRTGLIQIDEQSSETIKKVAALESKKQDLNIKLFSLNSALGSYNNQLDEIKPGFSDQFSNNLGPLLQQLQSKLGELEATRLLYYSKNPSLKEHPEREPNLGKINQQILELRNTIKEKANSLMQDKNLAYLGFIGNENSSVVNKISDLQQKIIQLRIDKAQADAQLKAANELIQNENSKLEDLPDNIIRQARLQRNMEINETLYKTITSQYAEASLQQQTQFGTAFPLDYATIPSAAIYPNKIFFIGFGFIFGLVFGTVGLILRDTFDDNIDGMGKLKSVGYPVLSVIPKLNDNYISNATIQNRNSEKINYSINNISDDWVVLKHSLSPIAESFRQLYNSILYSRPDKKQQTILVTSSKKGEGKTSVTLNLATVFSEAGKKVLIIDTDLRRPNIHKMAGLTEKPGLMELLFNNISEKEAIRPTLADNIFVLTTGQRPPNPAAVLKSGKMDVLLESLKKQFDHILIDTAPLGIIGDCAPLIRYTDAVLTVAHFKLTHMGELKHTLRILERAHALILGTVLVGFDRKKSNDYYYNRSYYYESYNEYVSDPK